MTIRALKNITLYLIIGLASFGCMKQHSTELATEDDARLANGQSATAGTLSWVLNGVDPLSIPAGTCAGPFQLSRNKIVNVPSDPRKGRLALTLTPSSSRVKFFKKTSTDNCGEAISNRGLLIENNQRMTDDFYLRVAPRSHGVPAVPITVTAAAANFAQALLELGITDVATKIAVIMPAGQTRKEVVAGCSTLSAVFRDVNDNDVEVPDNREVALQATAGLATAETGCTGDTGVVRFQAHQKVASFSYYNIVRTDRPVTITPTFAALTPVPLELDVVSDVVHTLTLLDLPATTVAGECLTFRLVGKDQHLNDSATGAPALPLSGGTSFHRGTGCAASTKITATTIAFTETPMTLSVRTQKTAGNVTIAIGPTGLHASHALMLEPGAPSTFAVTLDNGDAIPATFTAGCLKLKLALKDANGNDAKAPSPAFVFKVTGETYGSADCSRGTSMDPELEVPAGQTHRTFSVKEIHAGIVVSRTVSSTTPVITKAFSTKAVAGAPHHLVFTQPVASIDAGLCTGPHTVTARDEHENTATLATGQILELVASPGAGTFYTQSDTTCGTVRQPAELTLSQAATQVSFRFKASSGPSTKVTATVKGTSIKGELELTIRGPVLSAALSGSGDEAINQPDLGTVSIGKPVTRHFAITNSGDAPAYGFSVTVASPFTILNRVGCGTTLAKEGGKCEFDVRVTPTQKGALAVPLVVTPALSSAVTLRVDAVISGDVKDKLMTKIGNEEAAATSLAVLPNGRLLAAGAVDTGRDQDFLVVKRLADNTPDTQFGEPGSFTAPFGTVTATGGQGHLRIDFGGNRDKATAITVTSDGYIVLAGTSTNDDLEDHLAFVVLDASGQIVTAFVDTTPGINIRGVAIVPTTPFTSEGPQFGVVLAGEQQVSNTTKAFATRYDVRQDSVGTVHLSHRWPNRLFGLGGTTASSASAHAIGLQPTTGATKIILAGSIGIGVQKRLLVARLNDFDGNLDTTFSADGYVALTITGVNAEATAVAVDATGKIALAGWAGVGGQDTMAMAVLQPNGQVAVAAQRLGFGTGTTARASAVLFQDTRIVIAGTRTLELESDYAVARYNADGTLDVHFDGAVSGTAGGNGKITIDTAASGTNDHDAVHALALQPETGLLVAAGVSTENGIDHLSMARLQP